MSEGMVSVSILVLLGTGGYYLWKWMEGEQEKYRQDQEQYKILFERLVTALEGQKGTK